MRFCPEYKIVIASPHEHQQSPPARVLLALSAVAVYDHKLLFATRSSTNMAPVQLHLTDKTALFEARPVVFSITSGLMFSWKILG